ncbi:hypothetical protein DIPPA_29891 [Diplonema papillatum]|nr:hypothetical protein DIPPA_29891 [Diplonema papillatum]
MNTRATIQSVVDLDLGRGVSARDVAGDLVFEYVSVGVSSELQEQLRKRLGLVRSWLFAAEELGKRECAEFVRLGDELLEELRIESAAARVGCSPEELMKLESSDPLLRAVAKVWVERRWPESSESPVARRKRRINPAVRRRRKRDRALGPKSVPAPPQPTKPVVPATRSPGNAPDERNGGSLQPDPSTTRNTGDAPGVSNLPVVPARPPLLPQVPLQRVSISLAQPSNPTGSYGIACRGTQLPDSHGLHSLPAPTIPPVQQLSSGSDPRGHAAQAPATTIAGGNAAHNVADSDNTELWGSACSGVQRPGPVDDSHEGDYAGSLLSKISTL